MRPIFTFTLFAALIAAGCTSPVAPNPSAPMTRGGSATGVGSTPAPTGSFPTDLTAAPTNGGGNSAGSNATLGAAQTQVAQADAQSLAEALGEERDGGDYGMITEQQLNGVITAGGGNVITAGGGNVITAGGGNYRTLDLAASATSTASATDASATAQASASGEVVATDTPAPLPTNAATVPEAARQQIVTRRTALYKRALTARLAKLSEAAMLESAIASATPTDNGDGTLTRRVSLVVPRALYGTPGSRHVTMIWTYNATTKLRVASEVDFALLLPNGASRRSVHKVSMQPDGTQAISHLYVLRGPHGGRNVVSWTKKIGVDGTLTGTGNFWQIDPQGIVRKKLVVALSGDTSVPTATTVDASAKVKASVTLPVDGDPTAIAQDTGSNATAKPSVSLDPPTSEAP